MDNILIWRRRFTAQFGCCRDGNGHGAGLERRIREYIRWAHLSAVNVASTYRITVVVRASMVRNSTKWARACGDTLQRGEGTSRNGGLLGIELSVQQQYHDRASFYHILLCYHYDDTVVVSGVLCFGASVVDAFVTSSMTS